MSKAIEMNPNQNRTTDVVALSPLFTTLTVFSPRDLFSFSMKLLNLPTQAAFILGCLCRILINIVGNEIVRALRRRRKAQAGIVSLDGLLENP